MYIFVFSNKFKLGASTGHGEERPDEDSMTELPCHHDAGHRHPDPFVSVWSKCKNPILTNSLIKLKRVYNYDHKEEKKCISKKKGMDFTMNLFLLLMLVSFILIPQVVLLHPQLQRILPTPGWQWIQQRLRTGALKGNHSRSKAHTPAYWLCDLGQVAWLLCVPACLLVFMVLWRLREIVFDNHLRWSLA